MAMSKALGRYVDVKAVMDAALTHGSVLVTFDSRGSATAFSGRLYYYKSLLHEKQRAQLGNEVAATSTPYDGIMVSRKGLPETTLRIGKTFVNATVTTESGETVPLTLDASPSPAEDLSDDPLLIAALNFGKSLDAK